MSVFKGVALLGALLQLHTLVQVGKSASLTLEIRLYANESDSSFRVLETFSYDKPFTKTSSDVPSSGVEGYVYNLGDASNPVEPPFSPNTTWIALVRGSSGTLAGQLDVARTFGYSVVLAYGTNGSDLAIDSDVCGTQFPVALVDSAAADYVIALLSDVPPTSEAPSVKVYVSVGIESDFSIVLTLTSAILFALGFVCMFRCYLWQRNNAAAYYQEQDPEYYLNLIRQLEEMERGAEETNAARVKAEAEAEFAKLPVATYDPVEHSKDPHCPVCYGDFEQGTPLKVLPCGHFFHPDCVGMWLVEKHLNCPVCRQNIVKTDGTNL